MKTVNLFIFLLIAVYAQSKAQLIANFETSNTSGIFCESDTVSFINLSERYKFVRWDFGDGYYTYFENPKHVYSQTGVYEVLLTAYSENGDYQQKISNITISAKPELSLNPSDTVELNTGTPLTITATGNFSTIAWNTGSSETAITVNISGVYTASVRNVEGCTNEASVYVQTIEIPQAEVKIIVTNNILTPNDDGVNDFLVISEFDKFTDKCSIQIFNNRGKLVFENTDYKNDWNGIDANGNYLESGTYYYLITTTGRTGGTGFIDVLR